MSRAARCGRRAVLQLVVGGAALAGAGAAAEPARLRIGDPLPALTIATFGGGSVQLSSLRGRVLVVNFFASYCGPCRTELPLLVELVGRLGAAARGRGRAQGQGQGQGQGQEPLLLPVGIDERPADSAAFAQKLGVPAAVLVDPDGAVRAAFDPQRYPCTFLIDAAGTVRHINRGFGSGYGQRVERWLRDLLALPA